MTHAYQAIVNYKGDFWEGFLEERGIIDIFKPLLKKYPDPAIFKSAIRYIALAYSVESPIIIISSEWHENKKKIFEQAQVEPIKGLYEELVLIKDEAVLETINNWLEFQNNDSFKQVQMLRDLRIEMQMASLAPLKKSTGEVDYDSKYKCAGYAVELKQKIKDLESELLQNDPKLKEAMKEVKQATKVKTTIGPEMFSK